jgi:hypothetical protein
LLENILTKLFFRENDFPQNIILPLARMENERQRKNRRRLLATSDDDLANFDNLGRGNSNSENGLQFSKSEPILRKLKTLSSSNQNVFSLTKKFMLHQTPKNMKNIF